MPFYCYICPECGCKTDIMKPMVESGTDEFCEMDETLLHRDFGQEMGGRVGFDYAKPRVSDSLAMNPDQIPEHNKMFPDIKVLADGRPTFDSPKQQSKYLKATGFIKVPQKIKRRRKRVIK